MKLEHLLSELEQQAAENDAAATEMSQKLLNITRDTGQFLAVLIKASAAKGVLDIGTSDGYSTLSIASALSDDGHVTTLGILPHKAEQACVNFKKAHKNV